jgi:hypothetical protein
VSASFPGLANCPPMSKRPTSDASERPNPPVPTFAAAQGARFGSPAVIAATSTTPLCLRLGTGGHTDEQLDHGTRAIETSAGSVQPAGG